MEFRDMRAEYFDAMLRAKKGYSRVLDPICKQWNITRNELDVMLFLANNPGFDRAADIVSRRGLAKSHVSLSVGNLEARGLLTRHYDPGDRRTVHLKLTEQAIAIAKEGREAQMGYFSRIYAGLSTEEVEIWQSIMLKLVKNIADMDIAL
jgi:MarR family transcriptional regulator for hemolysin